MSPDTERLELLGQSSLTVVVCSLDGGTRIGRCLDALADQTVRAELEIIVVDDGSVDRTAEIAGRRDVVVVRHSRNLGAPAARNTGLFAATAPIVAFLDDDCEPDPDWAESLLAAYADGVTGVGGPIEPIDGRGFTARHLARENRHEPLELELAEGQSIPYRFLLYLHRQWSAPRQRPRRDVHALCGGNMSYRRDLLLAVNGFDEDFRFAAEEEDLARRLPGRLVFLPEAPVGHRGTPTLRGLLRRSVAYGRGNAMHYRKWPSVRPTVFPWPLLLAVVVALAFWRPELAVVAAVLPLLLYPAGLRNAVRQRRIEALADPYLRVVQEGLENVGFLRGAWRFSRLGGYGTALVAIVGLAQLRDLWAAQLMLLVLLMTVPGCLLLRALRVPGRCVAAFPLYVPAASLGVLLASGLLADLVWPLAGDSPPLRPAPLLAALELCCLLLLLAGTGAGPGTAIGWRSLPGPAPLLLPVAAAAGALQLNQNRGPLLAGIAVAACALALVFGVVRAGRWCPARLAFLLYAIALAMMWSYSLRGDLVYGYDIAAEYFAAHQTVLDGVWRTGPHPDAYGAMLSITVLPAQLHALTGLSDLLVLKLLYPAIFAMLPVGVFFLAGRLLPRRWAFVAAAFVLVQGGLAQQLPAVTRQEIALLMFLALCGAILDATLPSGPRAALVVVFGTAVVVSHYTTAYVMIGMLAGALLLHLVLWVRPGPAVVALLACGAAAFLWYVPVTHSTSNVGELRSALSVDGLRLLPRAAPGESWFAAYLHGAEATRMPTARYADEVVAKYRPPNIAVEPASDAASPRYVLGDALAPAPELRAPQVTDGLNLVLLAVQQLANLLGLAGAVLLALRRRAPLLGRRLALLALPLLGFLVLIRLSATFAIAYNPGRAQLQAMTLTSITMCWLLRWMVPRLPVFRPGRLVPAVAAASCVLVFLGSSGLASLALGGPRAADLSEDGEDVERFEMSAPELAAAEWLTGRLPYSADRVYADRYGQVRLLAAQGPAIPVQTDLTPLTLDRRAWIYASRTNTVNGRARSLFAGKLAIYGFPAGFIADHYDKVYTNGQSEVFHR